MKKRVGVLILLLGSGLWAQAIPPSLYKALEWREIGPFRGGRSVAVAGHPGQPSTYYFGGTGGGVWKTEDGGITWNNVSDGFFRTGSVGAIAVAESDPNVVYAGMGETCIRGNVAPGDGVYKSTDAGKTWKHIGLADTQFIGSVNVHPKNPDLVYVAALGHVFGPHPDRGVYRSPDGGKSWDKILYKNDRTGAVDLVLDPDNPRVLYAALWEVSRNPWSMTSGGPGSGLHKSVDGGDSWTELTTNPGLPKGVIGKIGVAASAARPDRVWAVVEAEQGGLFLSDDAGKTWRKVNEDRRLRQRPWYYNHVYADPQNSESVYVLNVQFHKSVDGGKSFRTISAPHGDHHDLWIDPHNAQRMINGNDGGANVSYNGGRAWSEQDQATAQFYHVTLDQQFPYHVYGAQQDNSTIGIASRTSGSGIDRPDWGPVGGGESGYIAVHPKDPRIVYAGSYGGLLTRYDHSTRQAQNIAVWPDNPMGAGAADLKYRFQWTFPIVISPHDPEVLYAAGNHVFRSKDRGMSWERISPDLTRNDKSKMGPSGGPITRDNTSVEYYGTVFTLAESPVARGVLWAGSDDGWIHVSRDGGASWRNVTPKDLPEWALASILEASPHEPGAAYLAATRYKLDDFRPYLYKTTDYGASWKRITRGIPEQEYTRVIREDPHRRGLLYAGTERGLHVSFDDGENWQSLRLNLPVVPIHDLAIHRGEKDLVAATHGRSFWILDDLTPLHQVSDQVAKADVHLFEPRPAYRARGAGFARRGGSIGRNPPSGAILYYYFKEKPSADITLELVEEDGALIKSFTSRAERQEEPAERDPDEEFSAGGPRRSRLPAEAGLNRFVWDQRYPDAQTLAGALFWAGNTRGPLAVPGNYRVRLKAGDKTFTQALTLLKDPRLETSPEDLKNQFDLLIQIRDKLSAAHQGVENIRDIRRQSEDWVKRLSDHPGRKAVSQAAKTLDEKITAIEEGIIQTRIRSSQDALNHPIRLNNKLAALAGIVASADARPTRQSYEVFTELAANLDAYLARLLKILAEDLPAFNRTVKEQEIPAVSLKPARQR